MYGSVEEQALFSNIHLHIYRDVFPWRVWREDEFNQGVSVFLEFQSREKRKSLKSFCFLFLKFQIVLAVKRKLTSQISNRTVLLASSFATSVHCQPVTRRSTESTLQLLLVFATVVCLRLSRPIRSLNGGKKEGQNLCIFWVKNCVMCFLSLVLKQLYFWVDTFVGYFDSTLQVSAWNSPCENKQNLPWKSWYGSSVLLDSDYCLGICLLGMVSGRYELTGSFLVAWIQYTWEWPLAFRISASSSSCMCF